MSELLNIEEIRNRIVEIRKVRLGDVAHNPRNWRGHGDGQRDSFRGVAREIGWAGVPLVYNSERTNTLTYVDGHMRKEELPDLEAEVAVTDLTDEEADLLLATYDPIGQQAYADREKLGSLLQSVKSGEAGVQRLLGELAEREGVYFDGNDLGLTTDYMPEESANKGLREIAFILLPDQWELVRSVLRTIEEFGAEYPGNEHKESNALYQLAKWYDESRE